MLVFIFYMKIDDFFSGNLKIYKCGKVKEMIFLEKMYFIYLITYFYIIINKILY